MKLGLQVIIALFIVLSYLWTVWCLKMTRICKEKKSILVTSGYMYTFILVSIWFIQLINHDTIIYWRIVELIRMSPLLNIDELWKEK